MADLVDFVRSEVGDDPSRSFGPVSSSYPGGASFHYISGGGEQNIVSYFYAMESGRSGVNILLSGVWLELQNEEAMGVMERLIEGIRPTED